MKKILQLFILLSLFVSQCIANSHLVAYMSVNMIFQEDKDNVIRTSSEVSPEAVIYIGSCLLLLGLGLIIKEAIPLYFKKNSKDS